MAERADPIPTIVRTPDYSPTEDAQALRAAMKGFGTDEGPIVEILTKRTNEERQLLIHEYTLQFGRNLIEDLKSELGSNLEDVIVALMFKPEEYLCKELHDAMAGFGTNEQTLVEIVCTRTQDELQSLEKTYESLYGMKLCDKMRDETSGEFRQLLTMLLAGARDEKRSADSTTAVDIAQKLFAAGAARWGTDDEAFVTVLAHENFAQLRLIFSEYKKISGTTISQAIEDELSGDLKDALLTIVECVQDKYHMFARRLRTAMAGMGTDDRTLIRIIVSRSEIDLANIKQAYETLFNKTLASKVKDKTSGNYKRTLLKLIGDP